MTITSSEIVANDLQADGRRYIRERHTDDTGDTHDAYYLAKVGTDHNAVMLARVAGIEAQIAETEAQQAENILLESAQAKEEEYLRSRTDAERKTLFGLTDEEVAVVTATDEVAVRERR